MHACECGILAIDLKAPVTPFRAGLAGKLLGTIFAAHISTQKARVYQYFTRISPGLARMCARKSDLPADKFWACSKLCPSKLRIIARLRHHQTPAWGPYHHQTPAWGPYKGRNLLVYTPLKESRLVVDLWPSRTSTCQLQSYCKLVYGQEKVIILPTCVCMVISADMGPVSEDVEGKLLPSCW